ncbi:conserved hypothetical protein [Uncinocarpus reesii 1704]|uniref:Pyridoxamine 5'-phosphate oxidase N-terminal domain-containing protein n=1 Tax=Uncinocarpus reesii (strain UAMH 1704) TaxID=336963 RepID=C4JQG7_UNCRE|nr:uncharacterized protein UREG_04721 [Uncinocarpus reesii 1704]EEP79875.1 conserved hypothetical protein [Uncinocarpus reesii 1704]
MEATLEGSNSAETPPLADGGTRSHRRCILVNELSICILNMVKYYPSLSPDFQAWILSQPVFFVGSAPSTGRHINLSPKGLPAASLALLGPNEVAYLDSLGSGNETVSHIRENGRCTLMFCSFEASPRIMRLFCRGEIIEWNEPAFPVLISRMALNGNTALKEGVRAVVRLDVFKVQTSCGYGVPRLALATDPETKEPRPYLKDRATLAQSNAKYIAKNTFYSYLRDNNWESLDGLPGLKASMVDRGMWMVNARIALCRWRRELELGGVMLLSSGLTAAVMWASGWATFKR